MNVKILKHIIESCDEALREAFVRRMDASTTLADEKIKAGREIYSPEDERVILQNVQNAMSPELIISARSLWTSLMRMARGRQYRHLLDIDSGLALRHEPAMLDNMPSGAVLCPTSMAPTVSSVLDVEAMPSPSIKSALEGLLEGKAPFAAVVVENFYDTEWLYSMIFEKEVYVNAIKPAGDGKMVVLMSKNLFTLPENTIISVAFSISMTRRGDLSQTLGVISEGLLNLEYLRVKVQNIDYDDSRQINIVFAELSGDISAPETRAALLQMERELPFFRVIGHRESV